jgi:hypothetical protein
MTPIEASRIIASLADGIDPVTGDTLPDGSPYQHPDVIRALFVAANALEKISQRERQEGASKLPQQAGAPWTPEEDKQLADAFDAGTGAAQLAKADQRTTGAITSRLAKLGKLVPQDRKTYILRSPNET